jgi:hypothetical protein
MKPTLTPSWPAQIAAKAAWNAVRANPASTLAQKKAACNAYSAAVRQCLTECGLA